MSRLVWFRTDLRVADNPALSAACAGDEPVIALFVITPGQWREHHLGGNKVSFLLESVDALRRDLNALNIPLLIRNADTFRDIPTLLGSLCRQYQCTAVYANRELAWNERHRDEACEQSLHKQQVRCRWFDDDLLLAPGTVCTSDGGWYQVFTPFKRRWLELARERDWNFPAPPRKRSATGKPSAEGPKRLDGFEPGADLSAWPAGETEARQRLDAFLDGPVEDYHQLRDIPAEPGTSQLSPYLAVGAISNRQCLHAALQANHGEWDSGSPGIVTWIGELIWREFYRHILVGYPRVNQYKPFKEGTDELPWRYHEADFQRWCEGRTGIPIVDAGMRQLTASGWMHNRLRMICAMFLTKNLFIDWRWGERFFLQHLVDADFASNNGGWQWSASTGTDAAPYFRVFNPVTQSRKFDPDGAFIRRYLPELEALQGGAIHAPWESAGRDDLFSAGDYPPPMVDLKESRAAAIAHFQELDGKREAG